MTTALVSDSDQRLVNRLRTLFTDARNAKRSRYDSWYRNYRLVNNRVGGKTGAQWQPAPKDSEIYPSIASLKAWMRDQHTTIEAVAACDPNSRYAEFMSQLANDLSIIMQTNWLVLDYAHEIDVMLWDTFMFEAGFLKAVWDQSLDGGMGNAMMRRIDPWALYVNPEATSLDDAEVIIEARRMSFDEAERRWPDTAGKLRSIAADSDGADIEDRPTSQGSGGRQSISNLGPSSGYNVRWASPSNANDMKPKPGIVVYEFWLKENDTNDNDLAEAPEFSERRVNARWRVIVVAADVVLMDEYADELWSHAGHPYERYVWDDIGEFYGISLVDHMAHPQMYTNRLLTALQQNVELTGNPIWVESSQSGLDRVGIPNRPGQRLRLTGPGAMQNAPSWVTPPEMSQAAPELVKFWIDRMKNISGMTQATGGDVQMTNRMAQDTLSNMQDASFVRVRNGLANLEATLQRISYKLADLIVDNFTDARFMATIGPTGQNTALALRARHFSQPTDLGAPPFKYAITVQAGASMPTSRTARMQEADQAYIWGIIDRQAWMEAHQYPNWQTVLDRVNKEIQEGTFNPPGQRQRRQRGGSQ